MYFSNISNKFNDIFLLRPPRRNSGTGYSIATINPPIFILHLKLRKGKITCKKMPVHEIFFLLREQIRVFHEQAKGILFLYNTFILGLGSKNFRSGFRR